MKKLTEFALKSPISTERRWRYSVFSKSLESDVSKLRVKEARLMQHKLGSLIVFKFILTDTSLGKILAKIEKRSKQ